MPDKPTYDELEEKLKIFREKEEALLESRDWFLRMGENFPDMIYRMSLPDGRYEYVSPSSTKIYGYPPEYWYENRIFIEKIIHPDSLQYFKEKWTELLKGNVPDIYEYKIVHKNGSTRWINQRNMPIWNDKNELIAIEGIATDITDRKETEEKLQKEKDNVQKYLDLAGVIFVALNREGEVTLINPKGCEVLGYSKEEIIGKNWFENFIPNWLKEDLIPVSKKILNGDIKNSEYHENPILTKDGEERIIAWHNTILKDEEGNTIGHLSSGEDITGRKKAEQELVNLQKMQTAIAEHLPAGMILVDASTREIESVNVYAASLFGTTIDEIVGKKCHNFICPASDGKCPICDLGQKIDKSEREIFIKDGSRLPVIKSVTIINVDGKKKLLEYFIDISSRKKAEEALSDSERKMKSIFRAAPVGIGVVIERVFKEVNDQFCEITGYSREELIGQSSRIVYPSDEEYEDVGTRKYKAINKYGTGSVDTRFRRKDGKIIDVILSSTPLYTSDLTLGVTFTAMEITERKKAEEALRESEEKYRSMMKSMDDGVYICSPDFRIEYMNPAMIKMLGRDPTGEACHKAIHGFNEKCSWCVHPKVMNGETIKTELVKSEDEQTYYLSHSPISHADGSVSKLSVYRDITEIKKLESRVQQIQKIESIGTLAGGIAHDFNNILSPIMIYTELIMDKLPDSSPIQSQLKNIFKASERAKDLVQQILTFSRQTDQEKKLLKVEPIVKEVIKLLRSALPSTIEIHQEINTESDTIIADSTKIHQVIMNLCTNAGHSMREKGGVLKIILQDEYLDNETIDRFPGMNPGSYLRLSVIDTGHGMDASTRDRIYDPYFTTKQKGEGVGLGLSVVHGIIKSYGGAMTVESEPGKGSSFNLYFPMVEEKDYHEAEIKHAVPEGTERILFVDDELAMTDAAKTMLMRLGYDVTARTSSIEALEAFRNDPASFDLVVTDMTMPNMTGAELARNILEIRPDIPIILCTGYSEIIDGQRALELGIRAFIMKPISIHELAETVRDILDMKENS